MSVRLNKFISEAGICSRRQADRMIEQGKVRVNGRVAQIGEVVSSNDDIMVNGNLLERRAPHVYLAYNKPVGVTTTTDRTDPDNIIKALGYHGGRVFPVGRLDKDSEGLILFTNDGDIVNKILRASNKHDKEYIVSVDKPITPDFVHQMGEGVSILGVMTRRCEVEKINTNTFRIVLNQGLNRQIRRMCEVLGYAVTRLQRVRIMHLTLSGIETGSWRFLTDTETAALLKAVEGSRKEPAPRRARKRSASRNAKAGSAHKSEGEAGSKTGKGSSKGGRKASSGSSRKSGKPKPGTGSGKRKGTADKGKNSRTGKSARSGKR
ncbi:ribosomal large subunit pseudouridine synthase F [Cyclonatronum proteinivorum]|uniref:Pseudouridine synthase n=1 Tax=Cyclonatronum proteinivorum TaxID=1457365 RepID=A0A345UHU2_9BACT|nr:23S rRNA pseudouridine(2604) synthase RluF [Cyclonatronum proteinivorum]AXJ00044.1 ribosomal large subunit pseudouridine synthase F [Cyclonatronum proteinivorum]